LAENQCTHLFFSTHNYRFAATSSDATPFNFLLAKYLFPKINYNIVLFLITQIAFNDSSLKNWTQ